MTYEERAWRQLAKEIDPSGTLDLGIVLQNWQMFGEFETGHPKIFKFRIRAGLIGFRPKGETDSENTWVTIDLREEEEK